MDSDALRRAEKRRAEADRWPVRRYELGSEPVADPMDSTSADERVALVWRLTLELWRVAGREYPAYARPETPGSIRRGDP